MWYGVCWAVGFLIALYITGEIVKRFFCYRPEFIDGDILNKSGVKNRLKERFGIEGENITSLLNGLLLKERFAPPREKKHKALVHFARRRLSPSQLQCLINRLSLDEELKKMVLPLTRRATQLSEHGWIFVAIGTVIGARLGHILFYHHPSEYFFNPLKIFRVWEGGLASHGAVFGILTSIYVWFILTKKKYPSVAFLRWTDLSIIPVLFGCAFIRIGNFFNQELLGTVTSVPWAIIFGNPEDGSIPQPRHPVQLYEAFFYFFLAGVLYRFFFQKKKMAPAGVLTGFLLVAVFTFRFVVEFWKEQQGYFDPYMLLHMGQILSIPCILLGAAMILKQKEELLRGVDSLGS